MKQRFILTFMLAALLFAGVPFRAAMAQFTPTFEDGMEAFNYGDNQMALRHFQPLANQGDPRAQYYLAYMMDSGLGISKDVYGAAGWYRKSAMQDYLPAIVYMGYIMSSGHGMPKDEKAAFDWYTKGAQMGDPIAQNNLATMLRAGKPYKFKDALPLAAQWFLQSAMQDNVRAQYNLATMYRLGQGVKPNPAEAQKWYTYAAMQGDMYAQYALGYMFRQQASDAEELAEKAGGAVAAAESALLKNPSPEEAEKLKKEKDEIEAEQKAKQDEAADNYEKAIEWYRRAAEQGNTRAQRQLARFYLMGKGGKDKGFLDAFVWYENAAKDGDPGAMYTLGLMYEGKVEDWKGQRIPNKDLRQAAIWYKKALDEKEYPDAVLALARMYETGEGLPRDLQKAKSMLEKVAGKGDGGAMMELGHIAEKPPDGSTPDLATAYRWYALAARNFDPVRQPDDRIAAVREKARVGVRLQGPDKGAADEWVKQWQPIVLRGEENKGADNKLKYDQQ